MTPGMAHLCDHGGRRISGWFDDDDFKSAGPVHAFDAFEPDVDGRGRSADPGLRPIGAQPRDRFRQEGDDLARAQATRPSPVAPAARSPRALAKAATKHTDDKLPVHSFGSLLADLATICLNTIAPADPALPGFRLVTTPTTLRAGPSTCSASATASASRSQQPAQHIPKAQVNGHPRGSLGGTSD